MIAQRRRQEVTQYIQKIFCEGGANVSEVSNDGSLYCEGLENGRKYNLIIFSRGICGLICWRERFLNFYASN